MNFQTSCMVLVTTEQQQIELQKWMNGIDWSIVNGTGTIMQECIWMNYNPTTQTQKLF